MTLFLFNTNKDNLTTSFMLLFSIFKNKKLHKGEFSSNFLQILEFIWFCWKIVSCMLVS